MGLQALTVLGKAKWTLKEGLTPFLFSFLFARFVLLSISHIYPLSSDSVTKMSADPNEKGPDSDAPPAYDHGRRPSFQLLGKTSPGVQRIEAISVHFGLIDKIFVFIGIFLISYAYGLDGTIRNTYQVCDPFSNDWLRIE